MALQPPIPIMISTENTLQDHKIARMHDACVYQEDRGRCQGQEARHRVGQVLLIPIEHPLEGQHVPVSKNNHAFARRSTYRQIDSQTAHQFETYLSVLRRRLMRRGSRDCRSVASKLATCNATHTHSTQHNRLFSLIQNTAHLHGINTYNESD